MGIYLKSIDPHKRPVSTSLTSGFLVADDFWSLWNTSGLDIVQYHEWRHEDIAEAFREQNFNVFQKLNKPLIIGEFGTSKFFRKEIMNKEGISNKEIHEAVDPMGINLHNGLWAGVFSGSIGALPWFIRDYVDKLDLYHVFTPLSKYIADWKINLPWIPVNVSTRFNGEEDLTYRILAMNYENETRIWIQNKKFNHISHYKGDGAKEVRPVDIIVPVKEEGAYIAEWWDTFTGEIVNTQQINSSHGELILPFSGTLKDMAVILRSVGSTGMKEVQKPYQSIEIFPNPTTGKLNVHGIDWGNRIKVFNSNGEMIYDLKLPSAMETISLNEQPSGMYLILVSDKNKLLGRFKALRE